MPPYICTCLTRVSVAYCSEWDWYRTPKARGQAVWTEPYLDAVRTRCVYRALARAAAGHGVACAVWCVLLTAVYRFCCGCCGCCVMHGGQGGGNVPMITYSVPVRQSGVFVGVVTMDVQLDSSSEVLNVGQEESGAQTGA